MINYCSTAVINLLIVLIYFEIKFVNNSKASSLSKWKKNNNKKM